MSDAAGAPCLGCRGGPLAAVRPYRLNTPAGREVFGRGRLYACAACGLVQLAPVPDAAALERYYATAYRSTGLDGADVADAATFPRDNLFYYNRGVSIAELVAPHVGAAAPRILDVGAGWGHVLHALGERFPGAAREAIEFSGVCVRHLRTLGVTVFGEPVERVLARTGTRYDLIVLSHVLEHLRQPADTLALLRRHLVPGGTLYIEVPHISTEGLHRHPDHRWAPRYDEPHLTFFTPATLAGLIGAAGFTALVCETAGPNYRYVSALQFRMPPLRRTVTRLLPRPVFDLLRRQKLTAGVRVHDREPEFFAYGGDRLWIRSVWRSH